MSRGTPSLLALLGLLAVAGYQNKDKIAEMLRSGADQPTSDAPPRAAGQPAAPGGFLGGLGGILGGGASAGGMLSGGLGELMDRFKRIGQGDTADSWVKTGPNQPVDPDKLEQALGTDVMASLKEKTGLSRDELLSRLSRTLPEAVDKYTPDGRLPMAA